MPSTSKSDRLNGRINATSESQKIRVLSGNCLYRRKFQYLLNDPASHRRGLDAKPQTMTAGAPPEPFSQEMFGFDDNSIPLLQVPEGPTIPPINNKVMLHVGSELINRFQPEFRNALGPDHNSASLWQRKDRYWLEVIVPIVSLGDVYLK